MHREAERETQTTCRYTSRSGRVAVCVRNHDDFKKLFFCFAMGINGHGPDRGTKDFTTENVFPSSKDAHRTSLEAWLNEVLATARESNTYGNWGSNFRLVHRGIHAFFLALTAADRKVRDETEPQPHQVLLASVRHIGVPCPYNMRRSGIWLDVPHEKRGEGASKGTACASDNPKAFGIAATSCTNVTIETSNRTSCPCHFCRGPGPSGGGARSRRVWRRRVLGPSGAPRRGVRRMFHWGAKKGGH